MRASATILLLLVALLPGSGCRTLEPDGKDVLLASDPPLEPAKGLPDDEPVTPAEPARAPNESPPAASASTAPQADPAATSRENDEENLQRTVAELVAAGALDRAAEQQLTKDLAKTDPALRGQLAQLLRTSLTSRHAAPPGATPPENAEALQADVPEKTVEPKPASHAEPLTQAPRNRDRKTTRHPKADPPAQNEPPANAAERPAPEKNVIPQAETRDSSLPENQASAAQQDDETLPAAEILQAVTTADAKPGRPAATSAAREAMPSRDWQGHLDAAVEELAGQLGSNPETQEDVGRHAMLRMLYLVDGKRDLALRPIPGAPPAQQDFWSKQIYGLSSYLDAERNSNPGRRAAEAALHLRDATSKLGELATLSVRNMAFCSEVKSYGIYKKFERYEFIAAQELLVYAEVENFKSVHTEQGYHTALRASYEIVDPKGARVTEQEFPVTEEHCQNPRRDFFVRYFIKLPPQIYGGKYTLHLYVVDENSQKMDQGSIEFTIKSKAN